MVHVLTLKVITGNEPLICTYRGNLYWYLTSEAASTVLPELRIRVLSGKMSGIAHFWSFLWNENRLNIQMVNVILIVINQTWPLAARELHQLGTAPQRL